MFQIRFNPESIQGVMAWMGRRAFFVANVNVNSDGKLNVNVNRLENSNVWNAENRHRVVAPLLAVSLAYLKGESFLSKPFRHPPSMRPISSSRIERSAYFSVGMSLFSQAS